MAGAEEAAPEEDEEEGARAISGGGAGAEVGGVGRVGDVEGEKNGRTGTQESPGGVGGLDWFTSWIGSPAASFFKASGGQACCVL